MGSSYGDFKSLRAREVTLILMGTKKSTEELIELQDEDDGEQDDIVYITNKRWSTHYHDSEDCRLLARTDGLDDVTREKAQMKWLGPCPVCVLEESQ